AGVDLGRAAGRVDVEVRGAGAEVADVADAVDRVQGEAVDGVGRVDPVRLAGEGERRDGPVGGEGEGELREEQADLALRRRERAEQVRAAAERRAHGRGEARSGRASVLRVDVLDETRHLVGDPREQVGQGLHHGRVGPRGSVRVEDEVAGPEQERLPAAGGVEVHTRPATAGAVGGDEVGEVRVREQVVAVLVEDLVEGRVDEDGPRGRRNDVRVGPDKL